MQVAKVRRLCPDSVTYYIIHQKFQSGVMSAAQGRHWQNPERGWFLAELLFKVGPRRAEQLSKLVRCDDEVKFADSHRNFDFVADKKRLFQLNVGKKDGDKDEIVTAGNDEIAIRRNHVKILTKPGQ